MTKSFPPSRDAISVTQYEATFSAGASSDTDRDRYRQMRCVVPRRSDDSVAAPVVPRMPPVADAADLPTALLTPPLMGSTASVGTATYRPSWVRRMNAGIGAAVTSAAIVASYPEGLRTKLFR